MKEAVQLKNIKTGENLYPITEARNVEGLKDVISQLTSPMFERIEEEIDNKLSNIDIPDIDLSQYEEIYEVEVNITGYGNNLGISLVTSQEECAEIFSKVESNEKAIVVLRNNNYSTGRYFPYLRSVESNMGIRIVAFDYSFTRTDDVGVSLIRVGLSLGPVNNPNVSGVSLENWTIMSKGPLDNLLSSKADISYVDESLKNIDRTLYKVVESIPLTPDEADRNKIFLVPADDTEELNAYVEYIYTEEGWEKLGEKVGIDIPEQLWEKGSGEGSILMKDCIASGIYSVAEGIGTTASGNYSHAEGESTQTCNIATHSEGFGSIADASYSHAEGWETYTSGVASHTEGKNTTTECFVEHAEGCYNISLNDGDDNECWDPSIHNMTLHTVGNGKDDRHRHNAHEIRQDGTHYIPDIYAEGEYYEKPMINLQEKLKQLEESVGVGGNFKPISVEYIVENTPPIKEEVELWLISGGGQTTAVIKVVREITDLGLADAKKLVDSAPSLIKEYNTMYHANLDAQKFKDIGDSVIVELRLRQI